MSEQRNDDKELTQRAANELSTLPDEMHEAELQMANLGMDLRVAKQDLADAEIEAQINCAADAKNAEGRKLQLEKAILESAAVQAARSKVVGLEAMQVGAETRYSDLHRRFRAALAITELQTAKINYLAKFERTQR